MRPAWLVVAGCLFVVPAGARLVRDPAGRGEARRDRRPAPSGPGRAAPLHRPGCVGALMALAVLPVRLAACRSPTTTCSGPPRRSAWPLPARSTGRPRSGTPSPASACCAAIPGLPHRALRARAARQRVPLSNVSLKACPPSRAGKIARQNKAGAISVCLKSLRHVASGASVTRRAAGVACARMARPRDGRHNGTASCDHAPVDRRDGARRVDPGASPAPLPCWRCGRPRRWPPPTACSRRSRSGCSRRPRRPTLASPSSPSPRRRWRRFPTARPIDRGFLAGLLDRLAAAGVAGVGLDVLFDRPTEPAKDAALRRALLRTRAFPWWRSR